MAGPIETRRPSFLTNSRISHSHLDSLHTSSCPPSYHSHKYKAFKTSSISDTMWNWDEDSPSQSHASSKSKQESDQISASTQTKMDSTISSKKTPEDLDLSKATTYRENTELTGSTIAASAVQAPFDPVARKKLLRKLDRHLIPFLALIYLLCYLDRSNVGNARLVGLEADLGMHGLDYNIALAIFFPFYVAAEIPSNMMMKRVRPSLWLTLIMVSWGTVMTCQGLVQNFSGLLACRVFLGIAEGGLFPGVNYFITMWYRRHECGFRMALFFSAATAAGAFGGFLARGISEMGGVGGKAAWSWIFILEGLLTLIVGSFSYWVINDYPSTAAFLTTAERIEVERRLSEDNGLSDEFDIKYLFQALKDWKIWVNMFITIGIFTPLYSISLFLPTILKELGYTENQSQLMTVPPYVIACGCTIAASYFADKAGQRGIFILGFQSVAIIGFLMLVTNNMPNVQYAGTFFAAAGIFSLVPLIGAWNSNNIGGSLKRGVGIAMQVGFGNFGGAISGFVYLSTDEPRFIKGHCILIAMISMSFILTVFMTTYLRRENARRDAIFSQQYISREDYSDEMKWEEREKGDYASFYRYIV